MLKSDEEVEDDGWKVVAVTMGEEDVVSETSEVESAELLRPYFVGFTSPSGEVSPVKLDEVTGLAMGDSWGLWKDIIMIITLSSIERHNLGSQTDVVK